MEVSELLRAVWYEPALRRLVSALAADFTAGRRAQVALV
jgi:hypothetical protein